MLFIIISILLLIVLAIYYNVRIWLDEHQDTYNNHESDPDVHVIHVQLPPYKHTYNSREYSIQSSAFDFEDKYFRYLEKTEDKITDMIDDLSENPKIADAQFQKALQLCDEYKQWCLSKGEKGRCYYECNVIKIEQDLNNTYFEFKQNCSLAESLSEKYGFSISYNDASIISSYSDEDICEKFYDYNNNDIQKYNNRIYAPIDNLIENPKSNLSHFEKSLSLCDEFENWCNTTIGGQKYYLLSGYKIKEDVLRIYEEYKINYDSHMAKYKEIQKQKRLERKIKEEITNILVSNDGSYKRTDLMKELDCYDKNTITKIIESNISYGLFTKQKINNRIYIFLSNKEETSSEVLDKYI